MENSDILHSSVAIIKNLNTLSLAVVMLRNNPDRRQMPYSNAPVSLPLPKLTPKTSHRRISGDIPTLVRKGQEHVLDEPGPVAFMGLSQMLDSDRKTRFYQVSNRF